MTKVLRLPTFSCPTSLGLRSVLRRSLLAPDLRASSASAPAPRPATRAARHRVLLPADLAVIALLDLAHSSESYLCEEFVGRLVVGFEASLKPLRGVADPCLSPARAYLRGVCSPHRLAPSDPAPAARSADGLAAQSAEAAVRQGDPKHKHPKRSVLIVGSLTAQSIPHRSEPSPSWLSAGRSFCTAHTIQLRPLPANSTPGG
jgi:hypothetical protein